MADILTFTLFRFWRWYYIDEPKFLIKVFRNFFVFGFRFFSFVELLKTLFTPFRRYTESYGRGFDIKIWATAIFSNFIFRTIGFVIRIIVLAFGAVFEMVILFFSIAVVVVWFLLPIILIAAFIFSLKLLFF